jgi:hypothetical protein
MNKLPGDHHAFPSHRLIVAAALAVAALSFAHPVRAQLSATDRHQFTGNTVVSYESIPDRPLTLPEGHLEAHAGTSLDLSSDAVHQWLVPFGASTAITPQLLLGADLVAMLHDLSGDTLISEARINARYLVVPEHLALELAAYLPLEAVPGTGIELLTPVRFRTGPLEVFGQTKVHFRGAADQTLFVAGGAVTALFDITPVFFAAVDAAFAVEYQEYTGLGSNWSAMVPVGVGAGARILPDFSLKAEFELLDLNASAPSGPFDYRRVSVVAVHMFDLSPKTP